MAEFKTKFFVLNGKHVDELVNTCKERGLESHNYSTAIKLIQAIDAFKAQYEKITSNKLEHSYYVCNQDEPYAKKVLKTILRGEDQKHVKDVSRRK